MTPHDLVITEAALLDERRWDEWLELYSVDCVFWAPAWIDEERPTTDPLAELSLIYYTSRDGLSDRVDRIRSGTSLASTPLARTAHAVTGLRTLADDGCRCRIASSFGVDVLDVRTQRSHRLFGRYRHDLVKIDDRWRIAEKYVLVLNDLLPGVVDVYSI